MSNTPIRNRDELWHGNKDGEDVESLLSETLRHVFMMRLRFEPRVQKKRGSVVEHAFLGRAATYSNPNEMLSLMGRVFLRTASVPVKFAEMAQGVTAHGKHLPPLVIFEDAVPEHGFET